MMRKKEAKRKKIEEIITALNSAKTAAILSLHRLPAAFFSMIRKKLRERAKIFVTRTALLNKALQKTKAHALVEHIQKECALITTDLSPFEIYSLICLDEIETFAKPGQIAEHDIIVKVGETQLAPGPILSELKSVGIDARIVGGKVTIAKECTLVKAGTKIKANIASVLRKLDIKPFRLRARILAATADNILYKEEILYIKKEEFVKHITSGSEEANKIAIKICWPAQPALDFLLRSAMSDANKIAIESAIPFPSVIREIIKKADLEIQKIAKRIEV